MPSMQRYAIFCTVIDNYGDIGTTWRLAQQLLRHNKQVELWVDNLQALQKLVPQTNPKHIKQQLSGILVQHWRNIPEFTQVADVVIEAFACTLPENYRQAMLAHGSICINLEYFSCEAWIQGCHGLRSFQQDGLKKYFFFPGIQNNTGGLLYEKNLLSEQQLFQSVHTQQVWCQQWQIPIPRTNAIKISLFGYENIALADLLQKLSQHPQPIDAYLPISKLCHYLNTLFPEAQIQAGETLILGQLQLHLIDFLPQKEFDYLLWLCDLNFVRGEDSLGRALLAAKPVVWHIYPTEDNAHWEKLTAFIEAYEMPKSLHELNISWNQQTSCHTLATVLSECSDLKQHATVVQAKILSLGELSTNLVSFIESKV